MKHIFIFIRNDKNLEFNMKLILRIFILLTLINLFDCPDIYAGGGRRNGSAGAQELLIPVGARGLSLSGSFVAGIEGVEAIYYNSAGLALMNSGVEVLFSHTSYIADIGISYAAIGTKFDGFGTLGFSIKSVDFGDIKETTVSAPQGTGSTFSPSYVTLSVTYSNNLTDRISIGAKFSLISESFMRTSANGFALDAGVMYNNFVGVDGLKIGIALRNLGPQMSFDGPDLLRAADDPLSNRGVQYYSIDAASFELPSQLEIGVAYQENIADDITGLFISSFENNNFSNDQYKVAAEFDYNKTFFVRGGYAYQPQAIENEENIFGFTFGAGIKVNTGVDITVDYAYRSAEFFDANHLFGIKVGF